MGRLPSPRPLSSHPRSPTALSARPFHLSPSTSQTLPSIYLQSAPPTNVTAHEQQNGDWGRAQAYPSADPAINGSALVSERPPTPPHHPIKIEFESAAIAQRSISPNKGGWKTISNGSMPTKTAIQRMFNDTASPPRGPRVSVSPQRPNGRSPPRDPAADRPPPSANFVRPPLPLSQVAPYIETAFHQWMSRGAPYPLRGFLVHYFGRQPDSREIHQMERLLEQSRARQAFAPRTPVPNGQAMMPPGGNHWSPVQQPHMRQPPAHPPVQQPPVQQPPVQQPPGQHLPARREPWSRRGSQSPQKDANSPNKMPLPGLSRYGRAIASPPAIEEALQPPEAPPGDVPPPQSAKPIDNTPDEPPSAASSSLSSAKRRAGPGELYERLACVGEGTYGKVYKARNLDTGQFVALKRIRMEGEKDGFPVTAMREIKLLQSLQHPNVLRLTEMMVSKGEPIAPFVARLLTGFRVCIHGARVHGSRPHWPACSPRNHHVGRQHQIVKLPNALWLGVPAPP